jgi:hypothetical protein
MMLPLRPPHELVEEDMASHPHVQEDLQERLAAGEMPPCYIDNPIVKASLTSVIPYAIFMDGLPYSLVDTVLGIWILNWLTGARSLVGLVRKNIVPVWLQGQVHLQRHHVLAALEFWGHGCRRLATNQARWRTFWRGGAVSPGAKR